MTAFGAIDLFSGSSSITGTNLFKVDKNPLNEIDEGVEDVIGKQAQSAGGQFISIIETMLEQILGFPAGSLSDLGVFFDNILTFLGDLNPLDPNFLANLVQAAESFIGAILQPTNLVALLTGDANLSAGVTGFIPLENLAMDLIAGVIGGAQDVIDAILAAVGFPPGSGTAAEVDAFFKDLLGMLANPSLTSGSFDPIAAVVKFITDMLHPTDLLAALVPGGDAGLPSPVTGHIPMDNLAMDLIEALPQAIIDTVFQTLTGSSLPNNPVQVLEDALQNIPNLFVTGVGGPANIGASVQTTWDQLIAGFVGVVSGSPGAGLADMHSIGYDVSSWASLGRMGWDILGVRNNKPIDQGLMATSLANFPLSRVAMDGSTPTVAVTETASATAFLRMSESNDKGVVSWLGSGASNITGCYVNIWEMDPAVGDMTLVHRSANIVGLLSGTMNWVVYEKPDTLLTHAGSLFGIEITVTGTGTHNVAGMTAWTPEHPSVYPRKYAATRNSGTGSPALGTVIPAASVVYSDNVPWVEWGITVAGAGTYPDLPLMFGVVGVDTVPIPSWANFVDVVVLGAGAGGGGGGFLGIAQHNGGGAGLWGTGTWARGVDFADGDIVTVTVPAGGVGGSSVIGGQREGGNTMVSIPGAAPIGGRGGFIDWGQDNGQGAGHIGYNNVMYTGGDEQHADSAPGCFPGGGGSSGNDLIGGPGGPGADGAVWLVFRQS